MTKPSALPLAPHTKAIVKLLVRAHRKRWGLFFVERAAGRVVATGLFQLNPVIDNVHDINTGQ